MRAPYLVGIGLGLPGEVEWRACMLGGATSWRVTSEDLLEPPRRPLLVQEHRVQTR